VSDLKTLVIQFNLLPEFSFIHQMEFSYLVSIISFRVPLFFVEGGTDWEGSIGARVRRGFHTPPWISSSIIIF
jgi:hypothetical protein